MSIATLPKPWFSQSCWYVKDANGKRTRVYPGTAEERADYRAGKRAGDFKPSIEVSRAVLEFAELASAGKSGERITLRTLAELYLQANADTKNQKRFDEKTRVLNQFAAYVGTSKPVDSLCPPDVKNWLRDDVKNAKKAGTRRSYALMVKACINWGRKEGYLATDPLFGLSMPTGNDRRDYLITAADEQVIAEHTSPAFHLFFRMCKLTGARPGEIAKLTVGHVETLSNARFVCRLQWNEHKTGHKTGQPRTIYLCPKATELVQTQMIGKSQGQFLFVAPDGHQWTENRWKFPIRRLRLKGLLPEKFVMYSARHTYITDKLKAGIPITTLAELVGNSPAILFKIYAHIAADHEFMFKAVD